MIEFNNVSFSYTGENSTQSGVNNLNLTINDGECILLCGRSGCGKSTVLKLINGLIPNYFNGDFSGEVILDGTSVKDIPMYKISEKVGSVFQNPRTQFFNVDTDSEIVFGNENLSLPQDELEKSLDKTLNDLKIRDLQGRNIFRLSGGEKQKIAFASIYSMNPDIYLLDEPSSNLDLPAIEELKDKLRLLKSQGKTIVIAEHRLYYLLDIADRIVYLESGRIEGIYTPEKLKAISTGKREEMGLRTTDLTEISPQNIKSTCGEKMLEINLTSISHKKREILKDVSLNAFKGEIIGIVGENGVGKTTFLRTLCGLHKDFKGDISWKNIPRNKKEMQKISYMVMQDVNYQLFADSVINECTFGIKDSDKSLVESTLEKLNLYDEKDRHPNTLSGGQKQRLAVAVSMVCNKELLIFDEPTSGLDFDSMKEVSDLIKSLSDKRIIFVVSHDYEFICRSCSRVIRFAENTLADDIILNENDGEKIRLLMGGK